MAGCLEIIHSCHMAVDTYPIVLGIDTSEHFGEMMMKHVFEPLLKGEHSEVMDRSMILKEGALTTRFDYLTEFTLFREG